MAYFRPLESLVHCNEADYETSRGNSYYNHSKQVWSLGSERKTQNERKQKNRGIEREDHGFNLFL
jgi:hypothetical protein